MNAQVILQVIRSVLTRRVGTFETQHGCCPGLVFVGWRLLYVAGCVSLSFVVVAGWLFRSCALFFICRCAGACICLCFTRGEFLAVDVVLRNHLAVFAMRICTVARSRSV